MGELRDLLDGRDCAAIPTPAPIRVFERELERLDELVAELEALERISKSVALEASSIVRRIERIRELACFPGRRVR